MKRVDLCPIGGGEGDMDAGGRRAERADPQLWLGDGHVPSHLCVSQPSSSTDAACDGDSNPCARVGDVVADVVEDHPRPALPPSRTNFIAYVYWSERPVSVLALAQRPARHLMLLLGCA